MDQWLAVPGFIVGVANPVFKDRDQWWDIMADLNTRTVVEAAHVVEGRKRARLKERAATQVADADEASAARMRLAEKASATTEADAIDKTLMTRVLSGAARAFDEEWIVSCFAEFTERHVIGMAFNEVEFRNEEEAYRLRVAAHARVRLWTQTRVRPLPNISLFVVLSFVCSFLLRERTARTSASTPRNGAHSAACVLQLTASLSSRSRSHRVLRVPSARAASRSRSDRAQSFAAYTQLREQRAAAREAGGGSAVHTLRSRIRKLYVVDTMSDDDAVSFFVELERVIASERDCRELLLHVADYVPDPSGQHVGGIFPIATGLLHADPRVRESAVRRLPPPDVHLPPPSHAFVASQRSSRG